MSDASAQGHAGPRQLRRLLDAVLVVGSELDLATALRGIIEAAADLVDARYGALGVLDETGNALAEFITVGLSEEQCHAIGSLPKGHGILGLLIADPVPLRLPDLREHPDSFGFPPNHPPMTSFLGVPIRVRDQVFGNLYLCDKVDDDGFTDIDEEMTVALAAAAGVAIENARLHSRVADIALFEDRERIARELHDNVIQRLFATGLGLQSAMRLAGDTELASRMRQAVDDLDDTIRELRSAIFELHTARLAGRSVRQEILDVCAQASRALGYDPIVRFDGPIDNSVGDALADHLSAVVREALSNVARHAAATAVTVAITASDGGLSVLVDDNGSAGLRENAGGRGIDNMRARATRLGGTLAIEPRETAGTRVRWQVPLDR
ncbi:MAG: GAF domain-containing protein [Acidimicrobiales bacterium]